MSHTNCMLDLETLGTGYDAMIVAIGAVTFGKDGLGSEFYCVVDPEKAGGNISPSTVKWWMQQNEDARSIFKKTTKALPEAEALIQFQAFCGSVAVKKELKVWGNGSDFDNVIIKSAFERQDLEVPWMYYNNRCFRTFKAMYPKTEYSVKGTKHNALDDAKSQAEHMVKLLAKR